MRYFDASGNLKNGERDRFLFQRAENSIGAERFRPREPAERAAGHRSRIRRPRFRCANTARQVQQVSPAPGPPSRHGSARWALSTGRLDQSQDETYIRETSTTRGYLRTPRSYNRFDVTPDPVNATRIGLQLFRSWIRTDWYPEDRLLLQKSLLLFLRERERECLLFSILRAIDVSLLSSASI